MEAIPVAEDLVAGDLQTCPTAQHDVVCPCRSGKGEERPCCKKCGQDVSYCHFGAVCSAYCSIAAATPSSSFERVIAHPRAFNSRTLLPITTGTPAKDNISMSLWLSPIARISSGDTPRRPAHSARAAPLETEG